MEEEKKPMALNQKCNLKKWWVLLWTDPACQSNCARSPIWPITAMIVVGQTRSCVRIYLARAAESCRMSLGVFVHVSCLRVRWAELIGKPERSINQLITGICIYFFLYSSEQEASSDKLQLELWARGMFYEFLSLKDWADWDTAAEAGREFQSLAQNGIKDLWCCEVLDLGMTAVWWCCVHDFLVEWRTVCLWGSLR